MKIRHLPLALLFILALMGLFRQAHGQVSKAPKAKSSAKQPAKSSKTTPAKSTKPNKSAKASAGIDAKLEKERLAILDEICACTRREGLTNLSEDAQNQKFGQCIVDARAAHEAEFVKIYGEQKDEDDYSWAEKVGIELSEECPYVNRLVIVSQVDSAADADSKASSNATSKPISADRELVLNALCSCFDSKVDKLIEPVQKISDCIMQSYGLEQEAFVKEFGEMGADEAKNREIGRVIGTELAPRCPSFMTVVTDVMREQKKGK